MIPNETVFLWRFNRCFCGAGLEICTLSFEGDGVGCIAFLLIHNVGVDLSRGHVFVRKHLADSVDVRAIGYQ